MTPATDPRRFLLELYAAALARVNGRPLVRDFLRSLPPESYRVVALGKAASAMALGALDVLGEEARGILVITKHGYGDVQLGKRATLIESGHPAPDATSLAAGAVLLDFVASTAPGERFLFLLSGGASALAEVLPEGVTLRDLERATRWLLGSGLDISLTNQVRKRLSLIKQGRLAAKLGQRHTLCLLLSDVPGDDPSVIGSGPLSADPDGLAPLPSLSPWLATLVRRAPSAPAADDPCFTRIETHVIASNREARRAVAEKAHCSGQKVHLHDQLLCGDVKQAATVVTETLLAGAPGTYIWGGETTIQLPPEPGHGGRCQQMALYVAASIAGHPDIYVLVAGTDGSDGPGQEAGALVDGETLARGTAEGFDLRESLVRADAGTFLEACGDLIATGPTGTNVMDLVIGIKIAPEKGMAQINHP